MMLLISDSWKARKGLRKKSNTHGGHGVFEFDGRAWCERVIGLECFFLDRAVLRSMVNPES